MGVFIRRKICKTHYINNLKQKKMDKRDETIVKVTISIDGESKEIELKFNEDEQREGQVIAMPATPQARMGEIFLTWAEKFYTGSNVNNELDRKYIYQDFLAEFPEERKYVNPQKFLSKIEAYCEFKGYEFKRRFSRGVALYAVCDNTSMFETPQERIGEKFMTWFDLFFGDGSGNRNKVRRMSEIYPAYANGSFAAGPYISKAELIDKMMAYCELKGYRFIRKFSGYDEVIVVQDYNSTFQIEVN